MERSALPSAVGAGVPDVLPRRDRAASAPPPAPPPMGSAKPDSDAVVIARQAAEEVATNLRQTFARFTVDHDTHEVSVQIVDARTNEVLRSIPNEDLRRMAQRFRASQGFVLDSAV